MSKLASVCTYHSKHFISLSVSYVSLQLLSVPYPSALALPRSRFCVVRGEDGRGRRLKMIGFWPLWPLHCTTLSSSALPLFHAYSSSFTSSTLLALHHWPRGPKHTLGSQEARMEKHSQHLGDEYMTEFRMTSVRRAIEAF